MPLSDTFNYIQGSQPSERPKKKRSAPFSLRLSEAERARLIEEARGIPLGAYIKAKVLGEPPLRLRRSGMVLEDRQALAQALALLGRSHVANNLNQLAHAANIGALPMTPETEDALRAALQDVRAMRCLLLLALGIREVQP